MFKKIIILFFIGTMFLSSYVYADEYKLYTVNFNIEGGEYLTEDIELILYYDDDTCTSILLENEKNYKSSLTNILDTIMVTAIVLAIVAAIFGIIAIRRIIK